MIFVRIMLWLLAGLVGLVLLLLLAGFISWQLGLDKSFEHTRETAELPLFPQEREGLLRVASRGMEFRARIEGLDQGGPVIIMLHGFPETSIMWKPLVKAANAAGMAAIAFDQRGYSPAARPRSVPAYAIPELVADVFSLAESLAVKEFHVVGHDWGAAIAWTMAMLNDPRISTVSALSIPHGAAFGEAIQTDPEQQRRSGYMAVFRMPVIPECLFGILDMRMLRLMHGVNKGETLDEYVRVFSEPGAMTAALHWYRANRFTSVDGPLGDASPLIHMPALFIGGHLDLAVAASGIDAQAKYMAGPFESHMRNAGHWLMAQDTDFVVETIVDFVRRHSVAANT